MNISIFLILFIIALIIFLYVSYRLNFKKIVCGAVVLITGGVKTGKSLLSVELALKEYKKRHRRWWWATHIFRRDIEEPLFYTNVVVSFKTWRNSNNLLDSKIKPHKFDYNICKITPSIFLRTERLAYKSVVYIQESSLLCDQQEFTDKNRNATLSLFNKLFGHESKGGILFYDTQCVLDQHYAVKRVLSSFFFIQKSRSFFFFRVLYIRELINTENCGAQNNVNEDLDFTTRRYIIWRNVYKKYDRYYFSYLTDDLPVSSVPFEFHGSTYSFSDLYSDLMSGRYTFEQCKQRQLYRELEKQKELIKFKQDLKKGVIENV